MQAAEAHGRPKVLVYRRTEKQTLDQDDPKFDEKRKQWKLVKGFFESFCNPDGSLRRGYNEYATPTDFEWNLEHDLQKIIKELLDEPETPPQAVKSSSTITEPPLWQGSPFPGLRPFTDQDAPIFFGRGRETDGLIRKLADSANRFIAVVGASGSGKSSLVWAGLIPRLRGQAAPEGDDKPRIGAIPGSQDWEWVRFTPSEVGDNPFMALATSLKPTLEQHGKAPREVAAELQHNSQELDQWVARALAGKPEWAELLVFIDQFEGCCQLVDCETVLPRNRALSPYSGRTLGVCDLLPRLESLLASGAIIGGGHPVTAWPEEVVDGRMDREKALCLARGLETAHLAFLVYCKDSCS